MNLTECLNSALPDIPALNRGDIRPRSHPKLVGREHIEDGEPIVAGIENTNYFLTADNAFGLRVVGGHCHVGTTTFLMV